jgi:hypothetical protein
MGLRVPLAAFILLVTVAGITWGADSPSQDYWVLWPWTFVRGDAGTNAGTASGKPDGTPKVSVFWGRPAGTYFGADSCLEEANRARQAASKERNSDLFYTCYPALVDPRK